MVFRNDYAPREKEANLPTFMDPDYNGNWDLEFDNVSFKLFVTETAQEAFSVWELFEGKYR